MKLCVLGNSHVASLKSAWNKAHYRGVEIDFFADRGVGLKDLTVVEMSIKAGSDRLQKSLEFTSGGKAEINPDYYDAFLLYGMGLNRFLLSKNKGYSRAVIEQSSLDHVKGSVSLNVLEKIRKVSDKMVYVGHNPLPAADGDIKRFVSEDYFYGMENINKFFYTPSNCKAILQPSETIVNGRFTDPKYAKGSRRLSIGDKIDDQKHRDADDKHMNDEFGKIWLRNFLDLLGEGHKVS